MKRLIMICVVLVCGTAAADTLTLSPAVVPLGGKPGQSTQQHLTLFNGTSRELRFRLVAKDVVVRNGVRVFADAGDVPGSIAATAVFSTSTITVPPHQEGSADVTLTLTPRATHRAVVILFQSTTKIGRATVSLGSLLTFELAGKLSIAAGVLQADAATASTNTKFALPVTNDGTDPAVVRGVAVLINDKGSIVGKVDLNAQRLLPGEQATLHAEYPTDLHPGHYRVIATLEAAKQAWTRSAVLEVP